jgi:hypothetical protein
LISETKRTNNFKWLSVGAFDELIILLLGIIWTHAQTEFHALFRKAETQLRSFSTSASTHRLSASWPTTHLIKSITSWLTRSPRNPPVLSYKPAPWQNRSNAPSFLYKHC